MAPRAEFHQILKEIADNVYFQPPNNVALLYPCIVYHRDYAKTEFADNKPYSHEKRYMVTVIDKDPDSDIPGKVAALPKSSFNRFFAADNLNHDVYLVFF